MKVHVLSDLHLEFSDFVPPTTNADLVILAGDIDTKCRGVGWANENFTCQVIYVCGNHEFYSGHIDHTLRKMRDGAAPMFMSWKTKCGFTTEYVFWSQQPGLISHPRATNLQRR